MDKPKILIVDDERAMLTLLRDFLGEQDYEISITEYGLDALGKIKKNNYDMLIANLNMPKISGLELLRQIKQLKRNLITIILTGSFTTAAVREAIRLGCFAYITKPTELEALRRIIKAAFESQRVEGSILLAIGDNV